MEEQIGFFRKGKWIIREQKETRKSAVMFVYTGASGLYIFIRSLTVP